MSQTENFHIQNLIGFDADAAVTKDLGAKLAAGREIAKSSVAGSRSVGVIADTVDAAGDEVGLVVGPCIKLITSGAAFADLAELAVDGDAKYQTATAGQVVVAQALAAASGADEKVPALLLAPSQYRVASANVVVLTDSTGAHATHDDTIAACGTAVTGVDGTGSNAASKADVDARLVVINQNFSDLAQKLIEIRTLLVAQGIQLGS